MGRTPERDQYVYSLTGLRPSDYEYESLEARYRRLLPTVLKVLQDDEGEGAGLEIQQKLRTGNFRFELRQRKSQYLEGLLEKVKTGSDLHAASQFKDLLNQADQLCRTFIRNNTPQSRDIYNDVSDTYDKTQEDLKPIIEDLIQQWHVLKGDVHSYKQNANLMDKITFSTKTVLAMGACVGSFTALNAADMTVTTTGLSGTPQIVLAKVVGICGSAAAAIGSLMAAIGYMIADIEILATGKSTIPEDFFKLADSFIGMKEKLDKFADNLKKIDASIKAMPAAFHKIEVSVRHLVLHH